MDINVRGDRFVHERAKAQPKVCGVLHHTERQSYAHGLQLYHRQQKEYKKTIYGQRGKVRATTDKDKIRYDTRGEQKLD